MKIKNKNGITLIALVITVIILLILAGTAISIAINGGDLFGKTNQAATNWNRAVGEEENAINYYLAYLNGNGGGSLTIPEGLKEGDTVKWTPSGTYKWEAQYYASDNENYSDVYLASGSAYSAESEQPQQNMTIDTWKVLSKENGKVTLVPAHSTFDANSWTGTVTLQGAQGYNNAVKLLNEACSNLYGGKGITARSINIEYIEAAIVAKAKDESDSENVKTGAQILAEWKADYGYETYTYNNYEGNSYRDETGAYKTHKSYPEIFEQEEGAEIDAGETGAITGGTLALSRQNSFIGRTNQTSESGVVGGKDASKTLRAKQTYYYGQMSDYMPKDGSAYASIAGANDYYWVASRCVDLFYGDCRFDVRNVNEGNLDYIDVFWSSVVTNNNDLGLFPVVSLSSGVLSEGQNGEYVFNLET